MAALSVDRATVISATGAERSGRGDVAANANIFYGAVIARNAAGFVVPATDAAAIKVIGIAQQAANNTGGADGAITVAYVTCVTAELDNAAGAIVQASKHTFCYVADDHSVTTAAVAVNDVVVGTVVSFTAATVRVFIDERANA